MGFGSGAVRDLCEYPKGASEMQLDFSALPFGKWGGGGSIKGIGSLAGQYAAFAITMVCIAGSTGIFVMTMPPVTLPSTSMGPIGMFVSQTKVLLLKTLYTVILCRSSSSILCVEF